MGEVLLLQDTAGERKTGSTIDKAGAGTDRAEHGQVKFYDGFQ